MVIFLAALTGIDQGTVTRRQRWMEQAISARDAEYHAPLYPAADYPGDGAGMGNIPERRLDQIFNPDSPIRYVKRRRILLIPLSIVLVC